jgi:SPP1 gp7 family putative phage head morphogenesis protein
MTVEVYAPLAEHVDSEAFWREVYKKLRPHILRLFATVHAGGMTFALEVVRRQRGEGKKQDDLDDLGRAVAPEVVAAADSWWQQFSTSTRRQMIEAFRAAEVTGEQPRETAKRLAALFSPQRAEVIAVTESSRLFGAGALATYRNLGYRQWEWTTVEDPAVEGVCSSLNGSRYPIETPFYPAHPGCRCFPIAVPEALP